ncbi:MAG TPA: hypothetical protein VH092_09350 [Urbifossiella sp.]|jgi:hypothetical protein|nr:hypothetical protein [Urbifossiella sp.]
MSLVNRAKLEVKLGGYATGTGAALADPLLVTRAQDYRRHTAARMIPLEPADILKRFPAGEYHVSLKIDGEFSLLVYSAGEALLVNPGGTVRVGLPAVDEAAALLKKAGVKSALIPGELHFTKAAGKRPRVHDVSRVARQPASQAELDQLGFAAFDIIDVDGQPGGETFAETVNRLAALFKGGKRAGVAEGVWLTDAAAIDAQFRKWVDQGAEGAVVRSDGVGRFKLKPRHTIDAAVIGFTEGTDDRRGMLHDLLLALIRPDGCLHVVGHVGGGFTNEERRGLLSDLKDMVVGSDYVEVNDQVAYHMVRPEWVVEVSVLDLIAETTRGLPISKMALHWDGPAARYRIVRRMPLVGMISPQFVRRREDKAVHIADIPLRQVTDLVDVPLADRDARQLDLPKSEILRREACTKQLKGQTMVRKLLMWKTNKDAAGEDFPAYVIHYTDYSPNRKTPLERDIRVSSSKDQIDQLWTELAAEAFTKGWAPAAASLVTPPAAVAKESPAAPHSPAAATVALAQEPVTRSRKKKEADPGPAVSPPPAPPPEPESAPPKRPSSRKKKGE